MLRFHGIFRENKEFGLAFNVHFHENPHLQKPVKIIHYASISRRKLRNNFPKKMNHFSREIFYLGLTSMTIL